CSGSAFPPRLRSAPCTGFFRSRSLPSARSGIRAPCRSRRRACSASRRSRPPAPCCCPRRCRRSSPGFRIGFSATLLGTLIGELFASDQGLGFMLIRAMEAHKVLDIMALTLLLFAFAASANALLLVVERRVHRQ